MNEQSETEPQQRASTSSVDSRALQANKLYQAGIMLLYGKRKSVDRAIKCVQRAIVLDDTNYKYWQLLGEAYYQRGSLNPAINCFMKSLAGIDDMISENQNVETKISNELDEKIKPDRIFSKLRMSDIRLAVLHLEEAMCGYNDIIAIDPKNVAALVGLSKTELQLACNDFSNGMVTTGHDHCMRALKYALETTVLCPQLCLTWKLASDCCLIRLLYGQRSQFESKIEIAGYPGATKEGLIVDKLKCIELAQQFLCKALTINNFEKSTHLWHNLGISLYLKAKTIKSNPESHRERKYLLRRSLECLFIALDNDRLNSEVRNSIGIVVFHLNLLNTSQSFLVKSIQSNMLTSEIQFSNLGYIYLQEGKDRLADVAFKRSQAEEPMYFRPCLGSALINKQGISIEPHWIEVTFKSQDDESILS